MKPYLFPVALLVAMSPFSAAHSHCKIYHPHHCTTGTIGPPHDNGSSEYYHDKILGGVNISPWCRSKFGSGFKAKLIGKTAGDWVCEQSRGNRRPIAMTAACKLQYGNKAKKAKALNWSDPYSWKCVARELKSVVVGVNIDPWCKAKFGPKFKAKLIGRTAGDWVCEQSQGNRRPIMMKAACDLQYGRVKRAKALNWNDPYSWRCIF